MRYYSKPSSRGCLLVIPCSCLWMCTKAAETHSGLSSVTLMSQFSHLHLIQGGQDNYNHHLTSCPRFNAKITQTGRIWQWDMFLQITWQRPNSICAYVIFWYLLNLRNTQTGCSLLWMYMNKLWILTIGMFRCTLVTSCCSWSWCWICASCQPGVVPRRWLQQTAGTWHWSARWGCSRRPLRNAEVIMNKYRRWVWYADRLQCVLGPIFKRQLLKWRSDRVILSECGIWQHKRVLLSGTFAPSTSETVSVCVTYCCSLF